MKRVYVYAGPPQADSMEKRRRVQSGKVLPARAATAPPAAEQQPAAPPANDRPSKPPAAKPKRRPPRAEPVLPPMEGGWITSAELAHLTGQNPSTVREWVRKHVPAEQRIHHGIHQWIPRASIERFQNRRSWTDLSKLTPEERAAHIRRRTERNTQRSTEARRARNLAERPLREAERRARAAYNRTEWLNLTEAGAVLGVNANTTAKWQRAGKFGPEGTGWRWWVNHQNQRCKLIATSAVMALAEPGGTR
jgi:hypothetical protein